MREVQTVSARGDLAGSNSTNRHNSRSMAHNSLKMESDSAAKENKIILLTIKNAVYPITTDVINKVAVRSGQIDRIVIFRKKFVQVGSFSKRLLMVKVLQGRL